MDKKALLVIGTGLAMSLAGASIVHAATQENMQAETVVTASESDMNMAAGQCGAGMCGNRNAKKKMSKDRNNSATTQSSPTPLPGDGNSATGSNETPAPPGPPAPQQ